MAYALAATNSDLALMAAHNFCTDPESQAAPAGMEYL
jgi:hypothetical protein